VIKTNSGLLKGANMSQHWLYRCSTI